MCIEIILQDYLTLFIFSKNNGELYADWQYIDIDTIPTPEGIGSEK